MMLYEKTENSLSIVISENKELFIKARYNSNIETWFIGQVMRDLHGSANPSVILEILRSKYDTI